MPHYQPANHRTLKKKGLKSEKDFDHMKLLAAYTTAEEVGSSWGQPKKANMEDKVKNATSLLRFGSTTTNVSNYGKLGYCENL